MKKCPENQPLAVTFDLKFILLFFFGSSFATALLPCQSKAQMEATGFIRNYNAVKTTPDHEILVGRNRFRFDLSRSFSAGQIQISNEVQNFYNYGVDSLNFRLREAYTDLYFTNSDLRVGKQIISWGRTDGAFIADILSPVNLSEFLTQDFSDIRTGLNALSYTRYFGSNYMQLIVNPVFQPNVTPRPGSRWFPRAFFDGNIQTQLRPYELEPSLNNAQFGGRFAFRSNLNFDLDLGVLYWHYPNPGYSKDFDAGLFEEGTLELTEIFTQSLVLLYSGTLQLGERLFLKSEASYYTKRSFDYLSDELRNSDLTNPSFLERLELAQVFINNTDGFLKERPWLIGMVGLDYSLGDWNLGGQVINEYIFDHNEQILQQEHFTYATLLLRRSFWRDKIEFRGFGRFNFGGEDFWINPELTYMGIDNIEATLGSQLFGGPEPAQFYGHLSFNNYRSNSFGYVQMTAYF